MTTNFTNTLRYLNRTKYLYLLLVPGVLYYFIFHYIPIYGIIIAFKDFSYAKGITGSDWNNFQNFKMLFNSSDFYKVLYNSISLSLLRIVFTFPIPILLALMLNEMRSQVFKRISQTLIYLPHFISWVVIGGIVINFLSTDNGIVNLVVKAFNMDPIPFLGRKEWFRPIIIITAIWKEAGWGTIIYLAAITGISPEIYEAATIDGASRIQRIRHVTFPGISSTISILLVLSIGKMMNNGFEQIYMFHNPLIMDIADVFEIYTYRVGLLSGQFSYATAVGLFQSIVGVVLITIGNKVARAMGHRTLY